MSSASVPIENSPYDRPNCRHIRPPSVYLPTYACLDGSSGLGKPKRVSRHVLGRWSKGSIKPLCEILGIFSALRRASGGVMCRPPNHIHAADCAWQTAHRKEHSLEETEGRGDPAGTESIVNGPQEPVYWLQREKPPPIFKKRAPSTSRGRWVRGGPWQGRLDMSFFILGRMRAKETQLAQESTGRVCAIIS